MNLSADQERRAMELFEREMLCAFRNLDNPQDISAFGATAQTPAEAEAAACRLALEYARELVWLRDECERLHKTIALSFGILWHINEEPAAPVPLYSSHQAAASARKLLKELLAKEELADGIHRAREHLWNLK